MLKQVTQIMSETVPINGYGINVEKMKQKYSKNKKRLTFPSVITAQQCGRPVYVALYLINGIPQHCQCSSEEEAWYFLDQQLKWEK